MQNDNYSDNNQAGDRKNRKANGSSNNDSSKCFYRNRKSIH